MTVDKSAGNWFDRSLPLLDEPLRSRAEMLRPYTGRPHHREACPGCRDVATYINLAFDAAYLDDMVAARQMLERAEAGAQACATPPVPAARQTSAVAPTRPARPRAAGGIRGEWRTSGFVPGFSTGSPLVAATDASWRLRRRGARDGGLAYIVSDGRYGWKVWRVPRKGRYASPPDPTGPAGALVSELRAVYLLVSRLEPGEKVDVLMDSTSALAYLRAWRRGELDRMPSGYSLRRRVRGDGSSTLERLAREVAGRHGLRFSHVKGHTGHLLNEAADALARMAARGRAEAQTRAEDLARQFLRSWHESTGH